MSSKDVRFLPQKPVVVFPDPMKTIKQLMPPKPITLTHFDGTQSKQTYIPKLAVEQPIYK